MHHLGLALGGRPGQGFARRLLLPVSKDTLLRVVRRHAALRWSLEIGQGVKLGSLLRRTDLSDGQTEAVFGGFQGESCA